MTQVTINGNTYSDDGSTAKDMRNGGHRTHFFPLVQDVVTVTGQVQTTADQVSTDAANVAARAAGYVATSTTSLTVGAGSKALTVEPGKLFSGGYVIINRTSSPSTYMHGMLTSYDAATGALVVDVSDFSGSGTHNDWTVSFSAPKGVQGPAGEGVMPYAAKTGAYTVVTTDRGSLIDCTSGTFTLAFQACATLGANWSVYIRNSGTGVVTLDPHLAETIDGAETYALKPRHSTLIQCDGSVLRVAVDNTYSSRLAIFSAAAAAASPVSNGEDISFGLKKSTGLTGQIAVALYGSGLFVANDMGASASVASSPDGATWTLRAMTKAATWRGATDGSNFLAIAHSETTINTSTNGTTWTAATALPGPAAPLKPAVVGTTWLVAGSGTAVYVSTNFGASWGTNALPAAPGAGIYVVGGKFWYWASGNTAYWSTTGLTGSWTAVSLPVTANINTFSQLADGTVCFSAGATGAQVYTTANGTTFTAETGITALADNSPVTKINGVWAAFSTTFGQSGTFHATGPVVRASGVKMMAACAATNGSTITVTPASGGFVLTSTASNSPTALFD